MSIDLNAVIGPAAADGLLTWPHRVLSVDRENDTTIIISLPRKRENGRTVSYLTGPRTESLSTLEEAIRDGSLQVESNSNPGFWALPDKDYVAAASTQKEKERRTARQKARDTNWAAIEPFVKDKSPAEIAAELPARRGEILARAEAQQMDEVTIYRLLHLFLANGCIKNGLMPRRERIGAPGKTRKQERSLGRKPKAVKRGDRETASYVLSDLDKERLARGYSLISPTLGPRPAFLLVSGAFWPDPKGETRDGIPELLDPTKRPSFRQFERWGKKLNDAESKMRRLGFGGQTTHHGGSTQSLTHAVGQLAMFDATSTDVYLTSMWSRLRRLPPMTRSTIKEVRSTAVLGFYVGWEPPSPRTALQAILCAAEDKSEIAAEFDIPLAKGAWPGMLFRRVLADNGEMRAARITEAEEQFGFGIEFTPTYSGESKGDSESGHAVDHRCFDNTIVGTTMGKRRERGEPHPSDAALWNYREYMRELILYYIDYNNTEVPELAPTAMIKAGVRPTRINIFIWLRDHGERADLPYDIEQLRAMTLPEWPAVMQYNGIVLKNLKGDRNIPKARFFSDELRNDHRFKAANSSKIVVPIKVRRATERIDEIWLPTSNGMIRVSNVVADAELLRDGCYSDLLDHMESEDKARDEAKKGRDQKDFETVVRKDQITTEASSEKQRELRKLDRKPSKARSRAGLAANRENEAAALAEAGLGLPAKTAPRTQSTQHGESKGGGDEATNSAMDAFLKRKRSHAA